MIYGRAFEKEPETDFEIQLLSFYNTEINYGYCKLLDKINDLFQGNGNIDLGEINQLLEAMKIADEDIIDPMKQDVKAGVPNEQLFAKYSENTRRAFARMFIEISY